MRPTRTYVTLGTVAALGTALVLVYGSGALGIIGAGHRADLLYLAMPVLGLVVALGFGLRARGLAVGMAVAALGTLVVGVGAVTAGLHRVEGASVFEILGLSAMFAAMWGLSAWLFSRAAHPTTG